MGPACKSAIMPSRFMVSRFSSVGLVDMGKDVPGVLSRIESKGLLQRPGGIAKGLRGADVDVELPSPFVSLNEHPSPFFLRDNVNVIPASLVQAEA